MMVDPECRRCVVAGYRGKDEQVFSKGDDKDPERKDGPDGDRPRVTYIPPTLPDDEESIFAHYKSGINFDKYDDILVDVSGTNPPQAIMTFEEATLCESLRKNVSKAGYVKPTPVQKHGIPIISAGRDLMACAQTGSGKTAAFLLPILQQLMADGVAASQFSELQEPEVIIVAPTRELINQIYLEARKFAHGTCVRPVVVYGGVGLEKLRYLVLDEADRMLDMGFEPDMQRLVSSPGMPSKENRQTLMFSATYPEDIQRMAADFLKTDYLFLAVGIVGGACSDVEQMFIEVTKFSKREQLVDLLKTTGSERTMVFVETKRQADFIATFLSQTKIPTTSIHGDREQREREKALADFRSGKCPVLVATSVAARGLDIPDVQHVVNFDLPTTSTSTSTGSGGPVAAATRGGRWLSTTQRPTGSWRGPWSASCPSGLGSSGFISSGKTFASTDSRKGPQGDSFQDSGRTQVAVAPAAADDEEWEGSPHPGPAARPEPAYSLYSTDSEDQVTTLHQGLDRCAALLGGILQAEEAAGTGGAARSRRSTSVGKKTLKKPQKKTGQKNPQSGQRGPGSMTPRPGPRSPAAHSGVKLHPPRKPVQTLPQSHPQKLQLVSTGTPPLKSQSPSVPPSKSQSPSIPSSKSQTPIPTSKSQSPSTRLPKTQTSIPSPQPSVLLSVVQSSSHSDHLPLRQPGVLSAPEALPTHHNTGCDVEEEAEPVPVRDTNHTCTTRMSKAHLDPEPTHDVPRETSSPESTRAETVQYLLGELKTLIAGRGSVAERLLSHLEEMVTDELEATKRRLAESEWEKCELASIAQQRLEEMENLRRILQSRDSSGSPTLTQSSLPDTEQQQKPAGGAPERIAEYLMSLGSAKNLIPVHPRHTETHVGPAQQQLLDSTLSQYDAESVWSDWTLRSGSTFNTRDEAAFRDGLEALDASIATLQKTIQLDLRR
ncbi:hypothetical protein INR49_001371 [Caranx melampygus]|nr:hypothetical protein INR49_001371 [Caranx melampygus]